MPKFFSSIVLVLALGLSLLPLYQNCSNVDFAANEDLALKYGTAEIVDTYISPKAWENRPKVNITAIIDNSNSMKPIQDKISQALSQAMDPLTDFSGNIELYTSTQEQNIDGADKISNIKYFLDSNNQRQEVRPSVRPYKLQYDLSTSYTIGLNSTYEALQYNPENFNKMKAQLALSIQDVGTNGSSDEQSLCSLLRAAKAKSDENNGDFNSFLIVTNEDDNTLLEKCIDNEEYYDTTKNVNRINNCASETDINNYASCSYTNNVQLKESKNLVRRTASYTFSDKKLGYVGPAISKAELNLSYRTYDTKVTYKEIIKSKNISFSASTSNDGIESSIGTYSITVADGLGQCSSTSKIACDANAISSAKAHIMQLTGKAAIINSNNCSQTCANTNSELKTKNIVNSIVGKCESASTATTCGANETDCNIVCTDRAGSIAKQYISTTSLNSCSNTTFSSAEDLKANSYQALKNISIAASEYDNSSDLLHKILNSNGAMASANINCINQNRYIIVADKNSVYSKELDTTSKDMPSAYKNLVKQSSCVDLNTNWKPALDSIGLNPSSLNYESCALLEKTTVSSNILDDTNLDWDNSLSGTTCSYNDLSTSAKSKIPSYVNTSTDLKCNNSMYSKELNASCSLANLKVNLCGDNPKIIAAAKSLCANNLNGLNPDKAIISCSNNFAGTYTIPDSEIEQSMKVNRYVASIDSQSIAESLLRKFGNNFFLASFITPESSDPKYNTCVSSNAQAFAHGAKIKNLGLKINELAKEDIASNYSICENSYAPAIENMVNKILEKVEFSYKLSLKANESVHKVFLINEAGQSTLVIASDYSYSNGILKILNKDLITDNTQKIRVQIWRNLLQDTNLASAK